MSEWDKVVSFKTEDMLNLALEWVEERKNILPDYLVWAKELIEQKRGLGNITGSEKTLFMIAVISHMVRVTYLRSVLLHTLDIVIGDSDE